VGGAKAQGAKVKDEVQGLLVMGALTLMIYLLLGWEGIVILWLLLILLPIIAMLMPSAVWD
jgi:hypothetical protein